MHHPHNHWQFPFTYKTAKAHSLTYTCPYTMPKYGSIPPSMTHSPFKELKEKPTHLHEIRQSHLMLVVEVFELIEVLLLSRLHVALNVLQSCLSPLLRLALINSL